MEITDIEDMFNDAAERPIPTLKQVMAVFDWLADMEHIAFQVTRDGCHARTHLMCRKLFGKNYQPEKIWALYSGDRLFVDLPDNTKQYWYYHVAPVIDVRMEDGTVEKMVIDPGLFNGPVPIKTWVEIIHASEDNVHIVPFGTAAPGMSHDYSMHRSTGPRTDFHAAQEMGIFHREKPIAEDDQRIVFVSPLRPHGTDGRTWVSLHIHKQHAAAEAKIALRHQTAFDFD